MRISKADRIVDLVKQDMPNSEIAEVVGTSREYVYTIRSNWKKHGVKHFYQVAIQLGKVESATDFYNEQSKRAGWGDWKKYKESRKIVSNDNTDNTDQTEFENSFEYLPNRILDGRPHTQKDDYKLREEKIRLFEEIRAYLPKRNKRILKLRYEEGRSLEAIAIEDNVTKEAISRVELKTLRIVREYIENHLYEDNPIPPEEFIKKYSFTEHKKLQGKKITYYGEGEKELLRILFKSSLTAREIAKELNKAWHDNKEVRTRSGIYRLKSKQ